MKTEGMGVQLDVQSAVEHEAYLVSRGVRPMSIIGSCELDADSVARARGILSQRQGHHDVIAFVVPAVDRAIFGFAASGWVVRLFAWLARANAPEHVAAAIQGMLLGYSTDAIARYLDKLAGESLEDLCTYKGSLGLFDVPDELVRKAIKEARHVP